VLDDAFHAHWALTVVFQNQKNALEVLGLYCFCWFWIHFRYLSLISFLFPLLLASTALVTRYLLTFYFHLPFEALHLEWSEKLSRWNPPFRPCPSFLAPAGSFSAWRWANLVTILVGRYWPVWPFSRPRVKAPVVETAQITCSWCSRVDYCSI